MKSLAALLAFALFTGCVTTKSASNLRVHLPGIREFLQGYVDQNAKEEENHFFLSPSSKQDAGTFVYVYWPTDNSVLALQVPASKQSDYLWDFNHRLELSRHIVEKDGTQNYWVMEPESVAKLLTECLTSGVRIRIRKKTGQPAAVRQIRATSVWQTTSSLPRPAEL